MFTYYVHQSPDGWYVHNILTGGRSQVYPSRGDAEAVRDWLQFNR